MKKMFFTAIAVVAFSGASMANTGGSKKSLTKPVVTKELSSKCVKAINAYIAAGYEWYDAIYLCC